MPHEFIAAVMVGDNRDKPVRVQRPKKTRKRRLKKRTGRVIPPRFTGKV